MLCIHTDGACSTNSRIGGWGYQVTNCGNNTEVLVVASGAKYDTTNNEMELTAVLEALKWIDHTLLDEPVCIYSDSAYIVNCLQEGWYLKWLVNGWMTADHKPVKHQELWRQIIELLTKFNKPDPYHHLRVNILKVDGHSGNAHNNAADSLAVAAKKALANKDK